MGKSTGSRSSPSTGARETLGAILRHLAGLAEDDKRSRRPGERPIPTDRGSLPAGRLQSHPHASEVLAHTHAGAAYSVAAAKRRADATHAGAKTTAR